MKPKEQMTFHGFNELFEQNMKDCKTFCEAYERTEQEHERKYGHRRYSYSNSFRVTRNSRIKNKKL